MSLSFIDFEIKVCRTRYVLIVEKDTIFFELLNKNFIGEFPEFALVTAKGFGDY